MSQITVEFKDFKEMVLFAKELLKGETAETSAPAPDPVKEAVPVNPSISYGQQIAPHFPTANTSQAPAAPVQPPVQQQTPVQAPPQPVVQTTAPSYTLEDLSNAAMQLMDKGMQAQLQQLLAGYGVESLPAIPAEQYGNFATALRGMGAQI